MKYTAALLTLGLVKATDDKVKIDLFYESQCPDCRSMINGSFERAHRADSFLSMVDITYWPYGNAHEVQDGDSWKYTCQHGEVECQWNLVESCAINLIKCPLQKFGFLKCIEWNEGMSYDEEVTKKCATEAKITNIDDILSCYKGEDAIKYEHVIAQKTESLSPSHQYVPWVLVNGEHDVDAENKIGDNLLKYVCDNYKGSKRSKDCPADFALVTPQPIGKCYRFEDMSPVELFLQ